MNYMHYVTGPIEVNTYVCYDETNFGFIVDPGGYDKAITKDINKAGISIKYIILTHGHADHFGGLNDFKKDFPNALIVASAKELEMLSNPNLSCSNEILGYPLTIVPDMTVKHDDVLEVGNMQLNVIATPGHTKGGISIYLPGYLFSGDTLFSLSVGRTDFYGGNSNELYASIKNKLYLLPDDTLVLPGHEEFTNIGREKKENMFVRA